MPTIALFSGINVYMYFNEHNPPHIHASYENYYCSISSDSKEILKGLFPKAQLRLVKEFIKEYKEELYYMWDSKKPYFIEVGGKNYA